MTDEQGRLAAATAAAAAAEKERAVAAMEKYLRPIFVRNLRKGILLTPAEMTKKLETKGFPSAFISSRFFKRFRSNWSALTKFNEIRTPTRAANYMSTFTMRYGHIFVDSGYLGQARYNKGHIGLLLGVEGQTHQMAGVPIKKRTREAFEEAMERLIGMSVFHEVSVIYSDRESAIYSPAFVRKLKRRHGVTLRFLHTR